MAGAGKEVPFSISAMGWEIVSALQQAQTLGKVGQKIIEHHGTKGSKVSGIS